MVMLKTTEPVTYELYDERGRVVGRIERPREESVVGPHAGTVLLRRDPTHPSRRSKAGPPKAA